MLSVKAVKIQLGSVQFEFNFELASGKFMAISGPSGVGKSTLLNTLLGFLPSQQGYIIWHNQDITALPAAKRPFGILFQQGNVFEHLSVWQNLSFAFSPQRRLSDMQKSQLASAAERFEIEHLLSKPCAALSGGQQQRVALARTFLQAKPVLLLDEPFSALDPSLRQRGLEWVCSMQQQGRTIIMVTHHLTEVASVADCVLQAQSATQWQLL